MSLPAKILIRETIFTSLIMAIGSESVKIKSQKLSRMSFHENFTPQNFLATRYFSTGGKVHPVSNFTELIYTLLLKSPVLMRPCTKQTLGLFPGLRHFYSLVQWRSRVTDDARTQHGHRQVKLLALMGHSWSRAPLACASR